MTDLVGTLRHIRVIATTPTRSANGFERAVVARFAVAVLALANSGLAIAEAAGERMRIHDGSDGLTCDYFNLGAGAHWRHRQGDWRDAEGKEQGGVPFAQARIVANNSTQRIEWDVTRLIQSWYDDEALNQGLFLRPVPGSPPGLAEFHSREADSASVRPVLVLTFADGTIDQVAAASDAVLDCSTYTGLGRVPRIAVGPDRPSVLHFQLPPVAGRKVTKAVMLLTTTDRQYGDVVAGVYRLIPPGGIVAGKVEIGLAAAYPRDEGIQRDPDVYMFASFDSAAWRSNWSHVRESGTFDTVASDPALKFVPLRGKALRVNLAKGNNFGLDIDYAFASKNGREPEEVYLRYYVRFADDWRPTLDGGKMPGVSGTYDRAGWGNRRSDGTNGWSMRGSFGRWAEKSNPIYGLTPLGTYAYHADMKDFNGEGWVWEKGQGALLARNRWYCVEQQVKLNTVGRADGVVRAWIDGVLVFEKMDVRMRVVPSLKIDKIWMNIYHGGTEPSPHDQHLYLDHVAIAKRYIGPMANSH